MEEKLREALKTIVLLHDEEWSDKYRELHLASDMAEIARQALEGNNA